MSSYVEADGLVVEVKPPLSLSIANNNCGSPRIWMMYIAKALPPFMT